MDRRGRNVIGGRKGGDEISKYIKILPLTEEKLAEREKMNNSPCSSSGQWQGAAAGPSRDTSHGDMVYILKGKVSSLRLMAIIWTASSGAALQAFGEAAASWGSAQAVTLPLHLVYQTGSDCLYARHWVTLHNVTLRKELEAEGNHE